MRISKSQKSFFAIALVIMLGTMACVRTLSTDATVDEKGLATDSAAETKDAAVQMTLAALLGTATNQIVEEQASNTPEATVASPTDTQEPEDEATSDATADASEATVEATADASSEPSATASATAAIGTTDTACYVHRYVYDESYPDGTRVDPGEEIVKTWRLQNVGSCDWVNGKYQLVFVSGDQMDGTSPILIEFTVVVDAFANFSVELTAPTVPGTYRGNWILESTDGDAIGWGPDGDQAFWLEIQVRGDTPTPTP